MTHKFEALICAILFTFWSVRLYYKLYDKKIRKYILSIGILIVFWMLIRMTKGVVETTLLTRLFWYLYYVPLIFIPSIFYICSRSLLKKINKKEKIIIYIISTILLLMVLTNDFHEIVFKFNNGIEDFNNYKHNIGYYLITLWIFILFGGGMIILALDRLKIKKDIKAFLPLGILLIGVIYTLLYVININNIRNINMSVVNSVLICLGIELALYLNLIPNNKKYLKTFQNSNLNMEIVSLDGNTIYSTKMLKNIPHNILRDIKNNKVKKNYYNKAIIYEVKKNKDSYVILKKDMTELYNLKLDVTNRQKKLLKLQKNIKFEEKTKKELYEITLRKEVVNKIENKLNEKVLEAKSLLKKEIVNDKDLERIKRIIIYCKKKSSIMISELNNEVYNEEHIKSILNELLVSMNNISGLVIVKNKMIITGSMMSLLYDIIYELIDNINNETMMIYISRKENKLILKILISSLINLKEKLKLDNNIKVKENLSDTDTELLFTIKVGDMI